MCQRSPVRRAVAYSFSTPMQPSAATRDVFGNADVVALILTHAQLSPASLAAFSRVCQVWRHVCRTDERLLTSAALTKPLTKRALMCLFALTSAEADGLPRGMRARYPNGYMYLYAKPGVEGAMRLLGGMEGWRERVERRSATCSGMRSAKRQCLGSQAWRPEPHDSALA